MSYPQLYQWFDEIVQHLPSLNRWQSKRLVIFALGVILAERCSLSKVAEYLPWFGRADSLERRFQRFVSDVHLLVGRVQQEWVRWVLKAYESGVLVLLVDETKLSDHLSVMLVGLAYQSRCIPLVWRCYRADAYPAEGQVEMIRGLLERLHLAFPRPMYPILQADRGIGTSPKLIQRVQGLGWNYQFRVQGTVRLRTRRGKSMALQQLVKPGESWSGWGQVFKKAGWLPSYVQVYWEIGQRQPWCLVTNTHLSAHHYGIRVWQEEGFRDLKSGGWQWQRSQVWQPAHAERLILVLTLAYAWVLTQGTWLTYEDAQTQAEVYDPDPERYSLFRLGLRFLRRQLALFRPVYPGLLFTPDKLLC
jgi:hypothetical protein